MGKVVDWWKICRRFQSWICLRRSESILCASVTLFACGWLIHFFATFSPLPFTVIVITFWNFFSPFLISIACFRPPFPPFHPLIHFLLLCYISLRFPSCFALISQLCCSHLHFCSVFVFALTELEREGMAIFLFFLHCLFYSAFSLLSLGGENIRNLLFLSSKMFWKRKKEMVGAVDFANAVCRKNGISLRRLLLGTKLLRNAMRATAMSTLNTKALCQREDRMTCPSTLPGVIDTSWSYFM